MHAAFLPDGHLQQPFFCAALVLTIEVWVGCQADFGPVGAVRPSGGGECECRVMGGICASVGFDPCVEPDKAPDVVGEVGKADLPPLARRVRAEIGRPTGFLRWMHEISPRALGIVSFLAERYAVSAQTPLAVVSASSTSTSRAAAWVVVQPRTRPCRRSIEM